MESKKVSIVNSILSNYTIIYLDGTKYIIREPTPELIYESYDVYQQIIDRHKFDDILTRQGALLLLVKEKLWDINGDKNFDAIIDSMDDIKLSMYKAFYRDTKTVEKLRTTLQKVRDKQNEMYNTRYQFDGYTIEGLADHIRRHYIYAHTLCDGNNQRLWHSFSEYEDSLVEQVILEHSKVSLDEKTYRELARTNPWSSYWIAFQSSLQPISNYRLEQLISYSRFYDNIRKNPECPDDDIFNDDDVLDGWVVEQRKEAEEDKKEKMKTPLGVRGKGDVFIPVRSQQDANKVYSQNAQEVRTRHKLRTKYIQDKGEVADVDMPDVKRDIAMEARRQAADTLKQKGKQ